MSVDLGVLSESLELRIAGIRFSEQEGRELIQRFAAKVKSQITPATPVGTDKISILLADAEQDVCFAIAEGGLTPAHERMVDALQKILAAFHLLRGD